MFLIVSCLFAAALFKCQACHRTSRNRRCALQVIYFSLRLLIGDSTSAGADIAAQPASSVPCDGLTFSKHAWQSKAQVRGTKDGVRHAGVKFMEEITTTDMSLDDPSIDKGSSYHNVYQSTEAAVIKIRQ